MGSIRVDQNVYQAITQASKDQTITADEAQQIRQEMEASGEIEAPEQQILQHMASGTDFTVAHRAQSTPISPNQLSFPQSSADLDGESISSRGSGVNLGEKHGTYATEKEAVQAARAQWGLLDDPDLAVVQNEQGNYDVYEVEIPTRFREDGVDFASYGALRATDFNAPGDQGQQLVAMVSDDNDVRYLGRESSPHDYGTVPYPDPITPVSASDDVRLEKVNELRANADKVLARLHQMEADLGEQKDHRGVFSAMYRVITERGIEEMDKFIESGDLRAAEFEGALLTNFANRYFDAYDAYASGDMDNVPEVWRSAFDSGRNAEADGYSKAAITEVVTLSMTAHIINDLPQTLQDIGYPDAADRDTKLMEVYDSFNGALMEEKGAIMDAVATNFGNTDMHMLDKMAGTLLSPTLLPGTGLPAPVVIPILPNGERRADALQGEAFTIMRTIARDRAVELSPSQIEARALNLSDALRIVTPGGN